MNTSIQIHPTNLLQTFSSSDNINQIDENVYTTHELNSNVDESDGDDNSTGSQHLFNGKKIHIKHLKKNVSKYDC